MSVETQGHRIRLEPATSNVKVALNGQVIADTRRPVLLHETGLPTRYYIPRDDVEMQLLTATDKQTECPFKGSASYWSVKAGNETIPNLVWSYEDPIKEAEGDHGPSVLLQREGGPRSGRAASAASGLALVLARLFGQLSLGLREELFRESFRPLVNRVVPRLVARLPGHLLIAADDPPFDDQMQSDVDEGTVGIT